MSHDLMEGAAAAQLQASLVTALPLPLRADTALVTRYSRRSIIPACCSWQVSYGCVVQCFHCPSWCEGLKKQAQYLRALKHLCAEWSLEAVLWCPCYG